MGTVRWSVRFRRERSDRRWRRTLRRRCAPTLLHATARSMGLDQTVRAVVWVSAENARRHPSWRRPTRRASSPERDFGAGGLLPPSSAGGRPCQPGKRPLACTCPLCSGGSVLAQDIGMGCLGTSEWRVAGHRHSRCPTSVRHVEASPGHHRCPLRSVPVAGSRRLRRLAGVDQPAHGPLPGGG